MKEQYQAKALHDLNGEGSSANAIERLLHEIVGEGTKSGTRPWHGGILSLPGFFWRSSPYTKGPAELGRYL
jgi:hypothetical protein